MDPRSGDRLGARRCAWGHCGNSALRRRQRRRVRKRGATDICEWLREYSRHSWGLRSAAGLLCSNAVRPTATLERQRVCQLQRPMGQRQWVQLSQSPTRRQTTTLLCCWEHARSHEIVGARCSSCRHWPSLTLGTSRGPKVVRAGERAAPSTWLTSHNSEVSTVSRDICQLSRGIRHSQPDQEK
jgi:hypothetical protein